MCVMRRRKNERRTDKEGNEKKEANERRVDKEEDKEK